MMRQIIFTIVCTMALLAQAEVVRGYYWFDLDTVLHQSPSVQGAMQIDAGALPEGVHSVRCMVADDQGRLSAPVLRYFAVLPPRISRQGLRCAYVLDRDTLQARPGSTNTGNIQFELDLAGLPLGLHCLDLLVMGDNGFTSVSGQHYFVKRPQGAGGLTDVIYWVNDNDPATVVSLERPTFMVQDSWQMPQLAFDPQSFDLTFESDGTPVAVGRNDLGIALTDAAGYATFVHSAYSDVRQRQSVDVVGDITGGGTFSHAAPDRGQITWWRFSGNVGDSVASRASRSSVLQLYSPTGQRLIDQVGAQSTQWQSLRLTAAGTYYVAQHSATGTGALGLTFFHRRIGDATGDGQVDIADVNLVINMMLGTVEQTAVADVTGDGQVDIADVNAIINLMLGKQ